MMRSGSPFAPLLPSRVEVPVGSVLPYVGSLQLDVFQHHEHGYIDPIQGSVQAGELLAPINTGTRSTTTTNVTDEPGQSAARARSETRPLNVAVHFIIKAQSRALAPNAAAVAGCDDVKDCWGEADAETCTGGGSAS